jgi:hypothetical protein
MAVPVTITFTTGPGVDLDPPQIATSSPMANDSNVPSSLTTASVTFNEPIDPGSAIATNCYISGPAGTVPGTLSFSADGLVLTFTLSAPLAPNSSYFLMANVTDLAGNAFAGGAFMFTTGN